MKKSLTILLAVVSLAAAVQTGRGITHFPRPWPCTTLQRPCQQPPPCPSGPNKPCAGPTGGTPRR